MPALTLSALPIPALPIEQWIEQLGALYDQYGYGIVLLSSLVENTALVGLILPGNSLVLLGAAYAKLGTLNLGLVILFATLGTVLGYHIDFFLGRYVFSHLASRWGKTRLGKKFRLEARLRLGRMFIHKHGGKAILLSHFVGHVRSFVAISAGMMRMNYRTFLFYEVLAALLWNTMYALIGYFAASQIDQLSAIIQRIGIGVLGVVVVAYLVWRLAKRRVATRLKQAYATAQQEKKDTIMR